jgi:hypothetical protein
VIVVGGGNNMICSPPLTKVLQNLFVVSHTPHKCTKQNKTKGFFCASFGLKCTKETRVVCHIVTLPFTLKKVSQGKRRITGKLKYFTIQRISEQFLNLKPSSKPFMKVWVSE